MATPSGHAAGLGVLEQPTLGRAAQNPQSIFWKKPSFPRIQVMGVWNSSRHTVQEMTPVFRARSLEQEEVQGLVKEGASVCG